MARYKHYLRTLGDGQRDLGWDLVDTKSILGEDEKVVSKGGGVFLWTLGDLELTVRKGATEQGTLKSGKIIKIAKDGEYSLTSSSEILSVQALKKGFAYGGRAEAVVFAGDDVIHAPRLIWEEKWQYSVTYGYAGDDVIHGHYGEDHLDGGTGNDRLFGGGDDDDLRGGKGNDNLLGGGGEDMLLGGEGNDFLFGDDLKDVLKGGGGRDTLEGGRGPDLLAGNGGADVFVFRPGFGKDVIADFSPGMQGEKIDLSEIDAIRNFRDLMQNHLDTGKKGVVIDVGHAQITLVGVQRGELEANDFIF